jgi:hypothetical protein
MDTHDITDDDLKLVSNVRWAIRFNRRWAWFYLVGAVAQIALAFWLGSLVAEMFRDVTDGDGKQDLTTGFACGVALGLLFAGIVWSAAQSIGRFLDGISGSKQETLLIKYFEIATGEAEGRNVMTNRST